MGVAGRPTRFRAPIGGRAACRPCAAVADAEFSCTSPDMFAPPDRPGFDRLRGAARRVTWGGDCYAYGLLALGLVDIVVDATMKHLGLGGAGAGGRGRGRAGDRLARRGADRRPRTAGCSRWAIRPCWPRPSGCLPIRSPADVAARGANPHPAHMNRRDLLALGALGLTFPLPRGARAVVPAGGDKPGEVVRTHAPLAAGRTAACRRTSRIGPGPIRTRRRAARWCCRALGPSTASIPTSCAARRTPAWG